jgi:hypothetical protein
MAPLSLSVAATNGLCKCYQRALLRHLRWRLTSLRHLIAAQPRDPRDWQSHASEFSAASSYKEGSDD